MKYIILLIFTSLLLLTGCNQDEHSTMNHDMEHSSSGELPIGIKEAVNPKFKVGDEVTIIKGHMQGMEGAKATIVGAYDTYVYAVSYDPTDGGEKVTNHQWVVHEEFKNVEKDALKIGQSAILTANHINGMKDTTATVDSVQKTTVYMIDYVDMDNGMEMKNHQWVIEDELSAQ